MSKPRRATKSSIFRFDVITSPSINLAWHSYNDSIIAIIKRPAEGFGQCAVDGDDARVRTLRNSIVRRVDDAEGESRSQKHHQENDMSTIHLDIFLKQGVSRVVRPQRWPIPSAKFPPAGCQPSGIAKAEEVIRHISASPVTQA